ncbi:MAG: TIGR02996 domain-containing protein [Rubripirellula sp.]
MHDESEFLAAVRSSPEDDAPRLVYADWLDEQGQTTRAELIRIQCEIHRSDWHAEDRYRLEKRETQLFRAHKDSWLGDLASMMRSGRFERGFVERVALTANQFVQHGEQITDRTPAKQFNFLQVSDKSAPKLAATPMLQRVMHMTVHGERLSDIGWRHLLSSPHLSNLRELELHRGYDSFAATSIGILCALALCPAIHELKGLATSQIGLETDLGQRAFRTLRLDSLQSIRLPSVGTDALRILSRMNCYDSLSQIDLKGNPTNQSGWLRRDDCPSLSSVRNLNLDDCDLNDRDLADLFQHGKCQRLERLSVEVNYLSRSAFQHALTELPALRSLHCGRNALADGTWDRLARSQTLAPLETLSMRRTVGSFSQGHMETLATCFRLRWLNLSACDLSDAAIRPLLESANMRELRWLDLSENPLSDQTASAILHSGAMSELRHLSLKETRVSAEMKKELRRKYGPGVCTFSR